MKRLFIGLLSTLGAIVLLLGISITVLLFYRQRAEIPEGTVLMLNFDNELQEYSGANNLVAILNESKGSLKQMVDAIDAAAQDHRVIGIVARLDHASMGIAQAQEIRDAMLRFRAKTQDKNKFTLAYTDTFGELGPGTLQYYLATSFDEIWMQPLGVICFTGLMFEVPFAREAFDKLHLHTQIERRYEYKSYPETFTEKGFTAPSKEALKTVMNSFMDQIIKDISVARDLREAETLEAIDHAPLLGKEAFKQGFVDRLAYFDEVKKFIEEQREGEDYKFMKPAKYLKLRAQQSIKPGNPKIALIYGVGNIERDNTENDAPLLDARNMGGNHIAYIFQKAIDDPDVKAIVFRINSGGGSAIASETISRAIANAKEVGKPVIVSMSDLAASGGYWIASHATKIVAHPGTITGSIGVFGGKIITHDLWSQLGIKWDEIHRGENATMWSNTQEYTPQEWQRLRAWMDEIYEVFLKKVSQGRKLSLEHVRQIAKGRIWSGKDALQFGLVDKLGDLHTAIELAKSEINMEDYEVPIQLFPETENLADKVLRLILDEDSEGGVRALINAYTWMPGLKSLMNFLQTLEQMIVVHPKVLEMQKQIIKG